MDIKKRIVVEPSDTKGNGPYDQHKDAGTEDTNPRIDRAEKSLGNAGVDTPWQNSHQITKGSEPLWQTHHKNSQGLSGQTSWEHKGAKRGNTEGPQQRENPWNGINSDRTDKLNQTY